MVVLGDLLHRLRKWPVYGSKRLEPSYSSFSVEELVRMAVGGDCAAFPELYRRYRPMLFGRAHRLLNKQEDAEDVVHDTFAVALEKLVGLRNPDKFPGWLQRILSNKIREARRKGKKWEDFQKKMVQMGNFLHKPSGSVPEPGEKEWYYHFLSLERTVPKLVGAKLGPVAKFMFKFYQKSDEFPSVRRIEEAFHLSHGNAERWRERIIKTCQQIAFAEGFSLDIYVKI